MRSTFWLACSSRPAPSNPAAKCAGCTAVLAGWDGRGMIELFDVLRREAQRDPGAVDVFFSTHPSPQDRIEELTAATAKAHGGIRDTAEFRAIKSRVLKLPAAHKMPGPT